MSNPNNKRRLREIIGILRKHNIASGISPENLPSLLEDLGPTYVKLGQIMSMQPTIFPIEYCRKLEKLRTSVTPMSFSEVKSILKAEYGTELNEIFAEIEAKPLGSASIAQVHVAKLIDGTKVVIKVQRSGIYETMKQDISLLKKATKFIKFVAPISNEIDIKMIIDEIWMTAKQEMNFIIEAENVREFYSNNVEVSFATCPKIMDRHSTSKVLVMEYIEGYFINDTESLLNSGYNLPEIAHKLAYHYVKQVIEDGFFHADPHCGNILIRDGKIVWIDLGMMGRLSSRDRKIFSEAIMAIANNDIGQVTDCALSIGIYKAKINYVELSNDIGMMLNKHGSMDFGDIDLIQLLDNFLAILKKHKISMPKGITMLLRGMATIQGTLRILNPELNLTEILANYMSDDITKNFDLKGELQSILQSLNLSVKKSLNLPVQLSDTLRLFSKGISKANLEFTMSDDMNSKVDRLINKIVVSIITASLLIGSSLICTTNMQPKILGIPALGGLGFLGAFILGSWIVFSIVKKP